MRALILESPETGCVWHEVAPPSLHEASDVLVRPLAVARCDLDYAIALGLYPMAFPVAFGHESVGEVVAVGDDVQHWKPGDHVIVPFQISCGSCTMCVAGYTNACESVPRLASFGLGRTGNIEYGGALSDLIRVPYADHMLLALPDGMSPERACGIPDNVSDGYRTVAGPLAAAPGEAVLVVGGLGQSVGLYSVAAAVALDAEVFYIDQDPTRLAAAARLGATVDDRPFDEARDLRLFAITVDACVTDQGRDFALAATRACGHCTSIADGGARRSELPLRSMYLKGVTYKIGRVHARATAPAVLDLVVEGKLDPLAIDHRIVDFDSAADEMLAPDLKVIFSRGAT